MEKKHCRTDYLFPRSSFVVGIGSLLSIASPYYAYNCSATGMAADKLAIESDFGVVGNDIKKALTEYGK